jgi:ABC-2 type transport system permease protein
MNVHVIRAIFKRNFVSYFSNPTGYVFICVFVLLSSFAAFWPNEFFNANLANLDQLNRYLPYILLVFIPAITMSIWADERRQGTDELLLTIPAADFDVVLGKYLAAVAIFSVSLAFSFVSNYIVLEILGDPDLGLLLGTYFGYWIVGLAMLGVGMVASFLTGNLTVGFILGALLNAPLVFAGAISDKYSWLKRLSISEQFHDFSRGVISFASITYFLAIAALTLYLAVVLLGRRHWRGGSGTTQMATHYLVRILSLVAVVIALNVFFGRHDNVRADVTSEKLNSLSPQSRELIRNLDTKRPVVIEYFASRNVPESYVQTRLNLLNTLREVQAIGGDKIQVIRHDVEPFSEEAQRAETQFGIRPVPVEWRTRGARTRDEIFLGLAFTCGLDKVVVPLLDRGIPAEYEIVRSIATVSQQKRKKVGVLTTDAKLYASFDMQTMTPGRNEQIVEELQKQYDVVQVNPDNPISERYDVLLAVQPSSLGPQQMEHFIAAVKSGQPTAIFEDPFPWLSPEVPGTKAPKMPPGGGNPFQQRTPPQPKGDIGPLWKMLGVDFGGDNVVWQNHNPYPKLGALPHEWVFVDRDCGAREPFNTENPVSARLQQVLFLFPGALTGLPSSPLRFTQLVATGNRTGTIRHDQLLERNFMGQPRMNPEIPLLERPTNEPYVMAAQIRGKLPADNKLIPEHAKLVPEQKTADTSDKADEKAEEKDASKDQPADNKQPKEAAKDAKPPEQKAPVDSEINVVLVSDIDCLYGAFFALRARGDDPDEEFSFHFDNVPFVLNVLDTLAGDDRFVDIRTRRQAHRTLTRLSDMTESARRDADKAREEFVKKFETARAKAQKEFDDQLAELAKRQGMNRQQAAVEKLQTQMQGQQKLEIAVQRLKDQRDSAIKLSQTNMELAVRKVQDNCKLWAVLLPPIPPLLVALAVFFNRRAGEREGVSKARLR